MIPQGCNQGTESILMSQAAKDYQGTARASCSREQGEPATEDDNEAGKDDDTTAKLSLHNPLTCSR